MAIKYNIFHKPTAQYNHNVTARKILIKLAIDTSRRKYRTESPKHTLIQLFSCQKHIIANVCHSPLRFSYAVEKINSSFLFPKTLK